MAHLSLVLSKKRVHVAITTDMTVRNHIRRYSHRTGPRDAFLNFLPFFEGVYIEGWRKQMRRQQILFFANFDSHNAG